MTKLQWTAVAAALGFGILAQIPNHDDEGMEGHHHDAMTAEESALLLASPASAEGLETVTLNITGMT